MFRILFAGESTTFGINGPVEGTFPYLTGEDLKRRLPEKKIQVINIAWPGKNSYGVLEQIEKAEVLDPDLVIVMTGYNDSATVYKDFVDITARGDLKLTPWYFQLNKFLAYHSVFYVTFREKVALLLHGTPTRAFTPATMPERNVQEITRWMEYYPVYFRKNLEKMIQLSRQRHFGLVFIRPPLSPVRIRERPLYHQAFERLMPELQAVMLQNKIPLIDLTNFYNTPGAERWVGKDGLHFTQEGNAEIAARVSDFLSRKGEILANVSR